MWTVARKELADHFNSTRFTILFCLVVCVAVLVTNSVALNIRSALSRDIKDPAIFLFLFSTGGRFFSLIQFIAFFGPLIGIILGFDAVNRERSEGTLSLLLSQPLFRDAIVNGKFLAGGVVITIVVSSIVLLISGLGMLVIGAVPTGDEVARMALFLLLSVLYIGFWLGLAILFSIIFRSIGTSALASIACWILVSFFVAFGANLVADAMAPAASSGDYAATIRHAQISENVSRASPVALYASAASIIMDPYRRTSSSFLMIGPRERFSLNRFDSPLDVLQSTLVVAPHLILILALTVFCFGLSYTVFMRQEIRAI